MAAQVFSRHAFQEAEPNRSFPYPSIYQRLLYSGSSWIVTDAATFRRNNRGKPKVESPMVTNGLMV
jgi:hypothetical protein